MPKGVVGSKAPHGTRARYQTHGCRCDECRTADRERARTYYGHKSREEYLASLPTVEHGTETKYTQGCRCDSCRAAATTARRNRRLRPAALASLGDTPT